MGLIVPVWSRQLLASSISCFDISLFKHKQFLPIAVMFWIVGKYKAFVLVILWTLPDLLMHGVCAFGSVISVFIVNKENKNKTIFGHWHRAGVSQ